VGALPIIKGVPPPIIPKHLEAALRRETRAALRRQKELQRQQRELAKASELDQARLAVESYENHVEVLLSVHKECAPTRDWDQMAVALEAFPPQKRRTREFEARQRAVIAPPAHRDLAERSIVEAMAADETEHAAELSEYREFVTEQKGLAQLAKRLLRGDLEAWREAIRDLEPFSEISEMGSSVEFLVHSTSLMECWVQVRGEAVIPNESKQLTSTGKLSVKQIPRARFHEFYQDHICSCIIRVVRESFALLPVETILVHGVLEGATEDQGSNRSKTTVLSVVIHRAQLNDWDVDQLDPSDTLDACQHRGDFKAGRRSGAFVPITPMNIAEVTDVRPRPLESSLLVEQVRQLKQEFEFLLKEYTEANDRVVGEVV
jgi:hypothetical protein